MAKENPHLLLLDEPTNHLDMESIDSLAKAINKFNGGMVLVSHDMRLISQVAKEIWMCDNKTIMRYQGEISDFKMQIQQQLEKDSLIEAGSRKKEFSTTKGPVLVPLGAPRKYGNEPTKVMTVAPPAPPAKTNKNFPALGDKPKTEEEEIMAARMELAELAISRQRKRQAEEKAKQAGEKDNDVEKDKDASEVKAEKQALKEAEESARAEKKRERKLEKEKALAYQKEQEAQKEARRLEKEADHLAAIKMQEEMEAARLERQRLRDEKHEKERREEEARAREEQAAKEARRAERQRVKREREEAKQRQREEEKQRWMTVARADIWTQEQQTALEQALLRAPMILESRGVQTMAAEKQRRWDFVAAAVPGKHRNQCLLRYKLLVQVVQDHRALQA